MKPSNRRKPLSRDERRIVRLVRKYTSILDLDHNRLYEYNAGRKDQAQIIISAIKRGDHRKKVSP